MEPLESTDEPSVHSQPESQEQQETAGIWSWVKFGLMAFGLMLFYIYNQHHANKALRAKDKLIKELKELHSEKISLESEITNASKQSEIAKKVEAGGLKELNVPPVKIENHVKAGKR
ncbi:MAG: hypothetical protein FJ347_06025 [Sphingomonadales bacterium]|nr:hypothetical protein [Sphingomonadales bacterium]